MHPIHENKQTGEETKNLGNIMETKIQENIGMG